MYAQLVQFAKEKIKEYPELAEQIKETVFLARDEISEGGSECHECELAENHINELIEEL
jgi:hypothetical protein